MKPPIDYPAENEVRPTDAGPSEVTLAMLLERHASEQPITNQMLEQACRRMDAAQELTISSPDDTIEMGIARFFKAFR